MCLELTFNALIRLTDFFVCPHTSCVPFWSTQLNCLSNNMSHGSTRGELSDVKRNSFLKNCQK